MITYIQTSHSAAIQQMRNDYLYTLLAPIDGMWESTAIAQATFWQIQDQEQRIGYFCLDGDNCLLRFHLVEGYHPQAQEIFHHIIVTYRIQHTIASTIEPLYFSLCHAIPNSSMLHSYLFHDHMRRELSSNFNNKIFRKARQDDLHHITRFYHANTEGPGEWIEEFLRKRLTRKELFVLYDQQVLLATGECIPSLQQTPYADLGMVVAQTYRGKGLGSSMLIQLKNYCYAAGWQPICSCAADNYASKKAIEKAGFVSDHSMVQISFLSAPPVKL